MNAERSPSKLTFAIAATTSTTVACPRSDRPRRGRAAFSSLTLVAVALAAASAAGCGGAVETDGPSAASTKAESACLASGTTRALLSVPSFYPTRLVSNGQTLYAGGLVDSQPDFQLWSASVASSESTVVDSAGFTDMTIAIGPHGSLVYLTGEVQRGDGGSGVKATGLAIRDAAGRTTTLVERGTARLADFIVTDTRGVSWVSRSMSSPEATLWRWDHATGTTRALGATDMNRHVGDGSHVFHVERAEPKSTIVATPVDGRAPRVVGTAGAASSTPWLVDVDAHALYYVQTDAPDSLFVMSKGSGEVTRLPSALPVPMRGAVGDETHLYWAVQSSGVLVRLDKSTGAIEELVREQRALSPSVAVDACNVYYAAGHPATVIARGK